VTDAATDGRAGPVPPGGPPSARVRRILVIGSGGAGKSTLAARIAERTGLPLVHLDALYWRPGWVAMPADEWQACIERIVAQDAWVMDGNYGGTLEVRLAASDMVVFLDVPRLVCLWRVVRRWLQYAGRERPTLPAGCPEKLSWEFVWWIWTYPARRRTPIIQRLGKLPSSTRVEVLRSTAQVERFMGALMTSGG
jgi:adenylate kinase family enzyme